MPLALREKIAADMREAAMEEDFVQRLGTMGLIANPGGPAEFAASIQEQRDQLASVARTLGLQAGQ
jgi:tripartite-type tricarboxylate transporter receptor subunit TctC